MAEPIVINSSESPESQEKTIDMAVEFGAMRQQYAQTSEQLNAMRAQQEATATALLETQRMIAELNARSSSAEVKADVAVAVAAEAAEEVEEVEEEEETGTLVVTPEPEIIEEVKPVPERHWLQNLIYGSK